jgi:ribosomal protein L20
MTARDKLFKMAKGFRGRSKNCYRIAKQSVEKALQYAYRDRKQKKRDMRSLWIQRVNAGSKEHGVRHTARQPPLMHLLLECGDAGHRLWRRCHTPSSFMGCTARTSTSTGRC